jgi:hypothetical protein
LAEALEEAAARTPVNASAEQAVQALSQQLEAARLKTASAVAEAAMCRREAEHARMVASEMTRLTHDNDLLANRLQQMEVDLRWVAGSCRTELPSGVLACLCIKLTGWTTVP